MSPNTTTTASRAPLGTPCRRGGDALADGAGGLANYTLAGRLWLRPSVEVGPRHDRGDAETGAGMDVGAGLVVSDRSSGLAVDVRVRMLLVHQGPRGSPREPWRCL